MSWWRVSQNNTANTIFNSNALKAFAFGLNTPSPLLFNIVVDTINIRAGKKTDWKWRNETSFFFRSYDFPMQKTQKRNMEILELINKYATIFGLLIYKSTAVFCTRTAIFNVT